MWLVAINHLDLLRKSTSITNIHTGPGLTHTEHFSHQEYWNNILGMPRANANKEGFRSEKPPPNDNKFIIRLIATIGKFEIRTHATLEPLIFVLCPCTFENGINRKRPSLFLRAPTHLESISSIVLSAKLSKSQD